MGNYVLLTDEQMVLLDGKCSKEMQKDVDAAKNRLAEQAKRPDVPPNIAAFVADVVAEATNRGKLICRPTRIRTCPVCKRSDGYYIYTRSSKCHRKGDNNLDSPKTFGAVELAERFIGIKDHVTLGCCDACFKQAKPILQDALKDIKAQISEGIMGYPPKWQWARKMKCTKCNWEGNEAQMGDIPAIFGGYYRGKCPQCETKNLPLGPTIIEHTVGFDLIEAVS